MTSVPDYNGPLAGVALLLAWTLTTVLMLRPPRRWNRRPDDDDR